MITVSTDGSCLSNPGGAIGWAWINHDGTFDSGGAVSGTNQVAELTALLQAVRAHPGAEPLLIESDRHLRNPPPLAPARRATITS